MARPAAATTWKNFANENYCLSLKNQSVTPDTAIVIRWCTNAGDQTWSDVDAPWNPLYEQIYNLACPAPPSIAARCAGVAGGSTSDNAPLIIWTCNNAQQSHDQGWHPVFAFNDANNHPCYYFTNEKVTEVGGGQFTRVFGVAGGDGEMVDNRPIILWDKQSGAGNNNQYWCAY
jgi:hypothetical protein